jgi:hypothetical protein
MTMAAWVLVWALGKNHALAIPGIADKAACEELGRKMQAEFYAGAPAFNCYEYKSVKP